MQEDDARDQEPVKPALPAEDEASPEESCSKKQYDELMDRFMRLQADFANYRKRTDRDRKAAETLATEHLMTDLLPVMDHLELALRHAGEEGAAPALVEGVDLVLRQLIGVLGKHGLQAIQAAGVKFDPRVHEALAHVDTPSHENDMVLQEHQRGYTLGGKVLRPTRVSVARSTGEGGEERHNS